MVTIIVNPVAGKQRGVKLYEAITRFVAQHRVEADVVKTIAPGDGMHLAGVALRKGHEHIVAVGGDGTIQEVLSGIVGQGVLLGIVPTGEVNGIARGLGIPSDWQRALAVALSGTPTPTDVGLIGERAFLGTVGAGAEVETQGKDAARARFLRFAPGGAATFDATLDLHCTIDGSIELEAEVGALVFANASARTSHIPIDTPDPHDGLLELTLLGQASASPRTRIRVRSVTLTHPTDLAFHVDGEIIRQSAPLVIRTAETRQRVLLDVGGQTSEAASAGTAS